MRMSVKNEEELHVYFSESARARDGGRQRVRKYVSPFFFLRYTPYIPLRDQQHNQFSNEPLIVSLDEKQGENRNLVS